MPLPRPSPYFHAAGPLLHEWHTYASQENGQENEGMEKTMEATIVYWGYIGIMEKKMETPTKYWGYFGIMQKKMETTI